MNYTANLGTLITLINLSSKLGHIYNRKVKGNTPLACSPVFTCFEISALVLVSDRLKHQEIWLKCDSLYCFQELRI